MKDIKGITKVNVLAKRFDELSAKPMPIVLAPGKSLFIERKTEQLVLKSHQHKRRRKCHSINKIIKQCDYHEYLEYNECLYFIW